MPRRRVLLPLVVAAGAAVGLTGCGLRPRHAPAGLRLTVTRDFGAQVLQDSTPRRAPQRETVVQLLARNARVNVRPGARGWFYYVNGIAATQSPARTEVHPGDHIWWDLHDGAAGMVSAVVGSWPEPFLNGDRGKRLPVRVDCAYPTAQACRTVVARLRSVGVVPGLGAFGTEETDALAVVVGTWVQIRGDPAASLLAAGPRRSGVYARFSPDGAHLELLDLQGHPVRALGSASGLVAATRFSVEEPTWLISGTDSSGVLAAARALDTNALRDRFAIAVSAGATVPVPLNAR